MWIKFLKMWTQTKWENKRQWRRADACGYKLINIYTAHDGAKTLSRQFEKA